MLYVVETLGVGLPDIYLGTRNWIPVRVFQGTQDEERLPIWIIRNQASLARLFSFMCVKGTENCAFGAAFWFGMVD
jgi:hypothetical protein